MCVTRCCPLSRPKPSLPRRTGFRCCPSCPGLRCDLGHFLRVVTVPPSTQTVCSYRLLRRIRQSICPIPPEFAPRCPVCRSPRLTWANKFLIDISAGHTACRMSLSFRYLVSDLPRSEHVVTHVTRLRSVSFRTQANPLTCTFVEGCDASGEHANANGRQRLPTYANVVPATPTTSKDGRRGERFKRSERTDTRRQR